MKNKYRTHLISPFRALALSSPAGIVVAVGTTITDRPPPPTPTRFPASNPHMKRCQRLVGTPSSTSAERARQKVIPLVIQIIDVERSGGSESRPRFASFSQSRPPYASFLLGEATRARLKTTGLQRPHYAATDQIMVQTRVRLILACERRVLPISRTVFATSVL
jgi:hypothetical protein